VNREQQVRIETLKDHVAVQELLLGAQRNQLVRYADSDNGRLPRVYMYFVFVTLFDAVIF
jgi:hypothetical protein